LSSPFPSFSICNQKCNTYDCITLIGKIPTYWDISIFYPEYFCGLTEDRDNTMTGFSRYIHLLTGILMLGFIFTGINVNAQDRHTLKGRVVNEQGKTVPFATVILIESGRGTAADIQGNFRLENIPSNNSMLSIESVSYQDSKVQLTPEMFSGNRQQFILEQSDINLAEVVIAGKSEEFQIREKAYSVSALDAKKFQNSNFDVGNVLKRVSGVNIREKGGLGSGFKFSINGLSGKQVKFFIDGVPMENYGLY